MCEFIKIWKIYPFAGHREVARNCYSQVNFRVCDLVLRFIYIFLALIYVYARNEHLDGTCEQIKKATPTSSTEKERKKERERERVKRISTINKNDLQNKMVLFICDVLVELIRVIQARIAHLKSTYLLSHSCVISFEQK